MEMAAKINEYSVNVWPRGLSRNHRYALHAMEFTRWSLRDGVLKLGFSSGLQSKLMVKQIVSPNKRRLRLLQQHRMKLSESIDCRWYGRNRHRAQEVSVQCLVGALARV